jgi:hypothetical protein
MADVFVNIETYWEKGSATCEPCFLCREKIMSQSYELRVKVGEKVVSGNIELCEACYELKISNGL